MFIFVATSTWTNATYHTIYSLNWSATPVPKWIFIQIHTTNRKILGRNISAIKTPSNHNENQLQPTNISTQPASLRNFNLNLT